VCTALGAGLFLLVEPLLDGDTTNDVPELVGVEQGEALNAISGFGWDVLLLSEESDDVEAGDVLRTDPAAGAELDEGDDFTMVVSSGPAPRVLPEITGATLDQATAALEALDLTLEVAEERNDDAVPAGVVLEWVVPDQPALTAGATVVRGTVVRAVVSSGPAPRVVPDLTGLTPADATARLEAESLVVAVLPEEFSPRVPAGAVARQEPAPGTALERGSTVSIVISKGQDLVAVPPLADLTQQQVADALAAAGLVLGAVDGDPAGVAVLAQVDGTSIGAGISLPRGTAVDVTFEVPPPPETAPPETAPPETAPPEAVPPDTQPPSG
jgi:eukaryotic-like serine/threonine-protein kinase